MQEHSKDIIRCKGVIAMHGHSNLFGFQGVHETLQLRRLATAAPTLPENEIVFIGRALKEHAICEALRTCITQPLPANWTEYNDGKSGRAFYVNDTTGEKTWLRPLLSDTPSAMASVEFDASGPSCPDDPPAGEAPPLLTVEK